MYGIRGREENISVFCGVYMFGQNDIFYDKLLDKQDGIEYS